MTDVPLLLTPNYKWYIRISSTTSLSPHLSAWTPSKKPKRGAAAANPNRRNDGPRPSLSAKKPLNANPTQILVNPSLRRDVKTPDPLCSRRP
ncbi:hypothetical protein QJS04_geneDACA022790 [Acorus gramineus]|uniref:Uncharacterized protein n=1 Tax=Acorus gramineus TaxID=55184 RepID=A0AAV9BAR6_ACOGR|nr:hypothetical protein QJS04_geneDACA022790 [Acorus gramineus]